MIKVFSYRKIIISTLFLLLALILYNYPTYINKHISYSENIKMRNIYLIDTNNYVVMTKGDYNSIYDLITLLKDNNGGRFKGLIPKDTEVLNYSINNGILSINFSNDIYNVSSDDSLLMIESIIYSITSLDNIDKIVILVEGKHMDYVPNTNIKLDYNNPN